ncbi:RES domain-containing protein [Methylocystis sp. B8]|uniref:RES domain-containing protein n=1 Tax=Methylocystis sp. B8 TaxID=544938 RepID=UPI0010FD8004|nr:RES domain-containing protein [Methylocystis sp. B8]TLG78147.1 hypothetical protein FEV16_06185 [Methylocystis sp. B8]
MKYPVDDARYRARNAAHLLTIIIDTDRGATMPFDPSMFDQIVADLRVLEIDEIKQRLRPLMIGYEIKSPKFNAGAFLYRARMLDSKFSKSAGVTHKDLIYPPKHLAKLGRLNRAGDSVFYASMHKESVFFELPNLKTGDELILTFWKTTEQMFVNNIGYTEFAFKRLGAKRPVPTWRPPKAPEDTGTSVSLPTLPQDVVNVALSKDENREIKEAFSEHFMHSVTCDESFRYKLTVAIGEMHLGYITDQNVQFAGILYPSVRMWANGDNIALLPWFVDNHLEFRKAVHVRIKGRTERTIDIDYLDAAHEFDDAGRLKWLGRIRAWTLKPQQAARFLGVAGQDDDGDYTVGEDGQPAHWTAVDATTEQPIYPE